MISPNWLTVEINKMKIKTLNVVSTGWINIKFEVNTNGIIVGFSSSGCI